MDKKLTNKIMENNNNEVKRNDFEPKEEECQMCVDGYGAECAVHCELCYEELPEDEKGFVECSTCCYRAYKQ